MANPTPTINQINAFNATQGTTIDFNIIGGTELVRSNRIYIYDLSDNSLICTHLYVSTESIHELPANIDSSIVYESGKSSADFVNGAQYYAQIQTYTDTAGTEGGSGLSVAKMFWCLVDPTLTITTIPSTISTTSYNVSATYNANTSVVSNIIQQYQFRLYSATGSLLQSSGVIVGSGTQQGTSTAYDISYNFTGLSVGSSYYVVVDVTTTQGMSVSVQSNTFTVSIDTPTLGEATVVNNACDGYISVTSNLSGEYGGSASGEIASFETDSVNNVSSLKVNMEPIQDLHGYDHPWVGGGGINKWDEVWELGWISPNGDNRDSSDIIRSKNYVPVTPNTTYCIVVPSSTDIVYFDENKVAIGNTDKDGAGDIDAPLGRRTTHDNCYFIRFWTRNQTTYNHNIAINYPSTVTTYSPYSNICPISGRDSVSVNVVGKNLVEMPDINEPKEINTFTEFGFTLKSNTYVISFDIANAVRSITTNTNIMNIVDEDDGYHYIDAYTLKRVSDDARLLNISGTVNGRFYCVYTGTIKAISVYWRSNSYMTLTSGSAEDFQIELGSTATTYEPYNGQTYTTALGQTVYGGTLDLVSGQLTIDRKAVFYDGSDDETWGMETQVNDKSFYIARQSDAKPLADINLSKMLYSTFPFGKVSWVVGECRLTAGYYNFVVGSIVGATTVDAWRTWLKNNPLSYTYELATPLTYQLTPQQINTLVGTNNVWSEQGDIELSYHIPITNLLVKRQDVDDVSGNWLTLYSQPIEQASDMDFTFIDFLNQYGKTYKYALVPLLTQTQSGVEVEVEGGYTVSDEVQSIFDGVFIVDATGLQKCKANVGYGDVDMNQAVGTITPIGAKYPVVITNSQNQYHNGSISGTIVPDDYYFNGNLSRIDMVNKRNELEQFLTNKRAKIIKDWNGNTWLVMIMENINCTFNNEYGMGIVNFTANWIEVGDPTNQQDLQATGLIDVGGV